MNPRNLGRVLILALTSVALVASVALAGVNKRIALENQLPTFGEGVASGSAKIFDDTARGSLTLDLDVKNLFCRSSGLDPITPSADQLGAAFYSLWISTHNEPLTRVHIFNTDCFTQQYHGSYNFFTYLERTAQSESDILDNEITVEVKIERDQDRNGSYEQRIVVLRGSG